MHRDIDNLRRDDSPTGGIDLSYGGFATKSHKGHSAATRTAAGMPIVRVGYGRQAVYLVPGHRDLLKLKLMEVSLISPTGALASYITLDHLDRLGN